MPATPGTIAEYDVVLSISQDCINKQFKLLYDHEIDRKFRSVGTSIAGGAATAPSKYAINHEFRIQVETYWDEEQQKDILDPNVGIFTHIECPRVELVGDDKDSVTITLTFKNDPTVTANEAKQQSPDSLLYYYSGPPAHPKLSSMVINGWQLSWQSKVRQQQINDVMKGECSCITVFQTFADTQSDLINKHHDPTDPTYVSPGVLSGMKTVSSENFTITSIFCLFEHVNFGNTFKVVDQNGKAPSATIANRMMDYVTKYFKGMAEAARQSGKGEAHLPNPDDPFVLGYGLMRVAQRMQDVNPSASWMNPPAYFIPGTFDLSTTKGSVPTLNTLNYNMLTYDKKGPGATVRHIDPIASRDAGNIGKSFFDVTKTSGWDGVMAKSRGVFWDKFIVEEIESALWLDPTPVVNNFLRSRGYENIKLNLRDAGSSGTPGSSWSKRFDFKTDQYGAVGSSYFDAMGWTEGHSYSSIELTSDFRNGQYKQMASDAQRRTYLACNMDFFLYTNYETYPKGRYDLHTHAYQGGITLRYKYVIVLEAGSGGTWSVSFSPDTHSPAMTSRPTLTNSNSELSVKDIGDNTPPANEYGAWTEGHEFNNAHVFAPTDILDKLKSACQVVASTPMLGLDSKLRDSLGQLTNTIVAPGGEVFTFTGMDTDSVGNLYSHVSYALGADNVSKISPKANRIDRAVSVEELEKRIKAIEEGEGESIEGGTI